MAKKSTLAKESKHGGARKGAGRKRKLEGAKSVTVTLDGPSKILLAYCAEKAHAGNESEAAREAIQRYAGDLS